MKKLILLAAVVMIAGCAFGQKWVGVKPKGTIMAEETPVVIEERNGTSVIFMRSGKDEAHRRIYYLQFAGFRGFFRVRLTREQYLGIRNHGNKP